MIRFKIRLKKPYFFGLWTSYLDIYILNKRIVSIFMNAHPEIK